jgi:cellulose synthase/poly-beta-1,6-N-acetylglucosamine synthase-like glycosyltransferase
MSYWEIFCYLLALGYAFLILIYFMGWLLIPNQKPSVRSEPKHAFSILVPARNEALYIEECIKGILNQDYPAQLIEVLVLDDHSTDNTSGLVKQIQQQYPQANLRLITANDFNIAGKKDSITNAVSLANHPYIVLTDADCTRGEKWLMAIDEFIQKQEVQFIYAPVFFGSGNFFEKAQSLEFAGLVGIGGAAIQLKNPNMCSAANLIFTKSIFEQVEGYTGNEHIASGDDEYLLHKVFKEVPNEVAFLKDFRAVVSTSPNATISALAQQRRRWVSKSTKYENRFITAILVGAYFYNLSMPINLILGFWDPQFWQILGVQFGVKMLAEGLMLGVVLRFFRETQLLLLLPLVQPFHIIYVIVIGIWANIKTYTWKERELS